MSLREWPEWLRFTMTGLAGALVTLVSLTLAWGDVRRDASDAKAEAEGLRPRVEALERRKEADVEWRNALDLRLGRIEAKIDRALERPR